MSNLIAGVLEFKVDGEIQNAKGNFTYNLGKVKRDAVVGPDRVHGFKALPQVPFIEGEITDRADLNVENFLDLDDSTFTLSLANGKVIVLKEGWFAGEGNIQTEEANIACRFEGISCEEVR
jgi:hypothetical protein